MRFQELRESLSIRSSPAEVDTAQMGAPVADVDTANLHAQAPHALGMASATVALISAMAGNTAGVGPS